MKNNSLSIKMILRGIIVFFLFFYSVLWQYLPVLLFHIDTRIISNNIRLAVLLSSLSDAIILFILLGIYHKDLIIEFKTFKNKFKNNIITGLKYWFTGLLIMFSSNIILYVLFKSSASSNEQLVRSFITAFPFIMGINVCLIAPIVEELVFRKTLKDVFKNKYLFALISFLLFGGAHIVRTATSIVDWLYIFPYGIMGLVFALADYKTDTVFTSIFTHILHNSLTMIMILFL